MVACCWRERLVVMENGGEWVSRRLRGEKERREKEREEKEKREREGKKIKVFR